MALVMASLIVLAFCLILAWATNRYCMEEECTEHRIATSREEQTLLQLPRLRYGATTLLSQSGTDAYLSKVRGHGDEPQYIPPTASEYAVPMQSPQAPGMCLTVLPTEHNYDTVGMRDCVENSSDQLWFWPYDRGCDSCVEDLDVKCCSTIWPVNESSNARYFANQKKGKDYGLSIGPTGDSLYMSPHDWVRGNWYFPGDVFPATEEQATPLRDDSMALDNIVVSADGQIAKNDPSQEANWYMPLRTGTTTTTTVAPSPPQFISAGVIGAVAQRTVEEVLQRLSTDPDLVDELIFSKIDSTPISASGEVNAVFMLIGWTLTDFSLGDVSFGGYDEGVHVEAIANNQYKVTLAGVQANDIEASVHLKQYDGILEEDADCTIGVVGGDLWFIVGFSVDENGELKLDIGPPGCLGTDCNYCGANLQVSDISIDDQSGFADAFDLLIPSMQDTITASLNAQACEQTAASIGEILEGLDLKYTIEHTLPSPFDTSLSVEFDYHLVQAAALNSTGEEYLGIAVRGEVSPDAQTKSGRDPPTFRFQKDVGTSLELQVNNYTIETFLWTLGYKKALSITLKDFYDTADLPTWVKAVLFVFPKLQNQKVNAAVLATGAPSVNMTSTGFDVRGDFQAALYVENPDMFTFLNLTGNGDMSIEIRDVRDNASVAPQTKADCRYQLVPTLHNFTIIDGTSPYVSVDIALKLAELFHGVLLSAIQTQLSKMELVAGLNYTLVSVPIPNTTFDLLIKPRDISLHMAEALKAQITLGFDVNRSRQA